MDCLGAESLRILLNSKKLCHSKLEMMPIWASKTHIKGVHMGYILILFQYYYKDLLLILNCSGKN